VRGQPRGGATTMAALDGSFDAVFLVGHHAKVGDYPGICAHTISYGDYRDVRLAGRSVSEGETFATVAAQHGVPTALVTGDDVVATELSRVCPGIETAVVKRALSRTAAAIVPPVRARRIITDAARRAVERVRAGEIAAPEFDSPFAMEVELRSPLSEAAREAFTLRFPEFQLVGDRTVAFSQAEMHRAYRMAAIVQFIAARPAAVRSY
ncbi:MAG TPA: M55 family metallopeptidase, partial [Acidimicrobiia bacterium]